MRYLKKLLFMQLTVIFLCTVSYGQTTNIFTGAVNSNWHVAGNWSQSTIPTTTDGYVTTFNSSSPNCTINTTGLGCNAIDFTAYTHTITFTFGLTVSGNVKLGSGMSFSGPGSLSVNATATFTSNGIIFPQVLSLSTSSGAITFADNANIISKLDSTRHGNSGNDKWWYAGNAASAGYRPAQKCRRQ